MTRAIAKGAAWMVLFKLAERSLGLVSVLILARVLVPADFGLVAMAMSVIALIELASSFGFDLSLIQRQHPTREHYDTAWTLNLLLGIACALITAALAYPTALFYGEPQLTAVMLVLAASWVVGGFENIGVVDFRRRMDFSNEFRFLAAKKFVAFTVTVSLALLLRSYWALVAGMVAGRLTGVGLSYWMQPYRPCLTLSARGELLSFSRWMLVYNALVFSAARLSHFVIGRSYGAASLGVYTVGSEVGLLPATELLAPINRAVFPGYARMAGDHDALKKGFLDVLAVTAVLALPASFGVAAIADPLVRTLLGPKWLEAIVIVQILSFVGAFYALMSSTHSALLALGRTDAVALLAGVRLAALIALLAVLSPTRSVIGIAYAELAAFLLMFLASYPVLRRAINVPVRAYAANLWRPLAASAVMVVVVTAVLGRLAANPSSVGALMQLAIAVPLGVATYAAALIVLWFWSGKPRSAESIILAWLVEVLPLVLRARNRSTE